MTPEQPSEQDDIDPPPIAGEVPKGPDDPILIGKVKYSVEMPLMQVSMDLSEFLDLVSHKPGEYTIEVKPFQ